MTIIQARKTGYHCPASLTRIHDQAGGTSSAGRPLSSLHHLERDRLALLQALEAAAGNDTKMHE